MKRKSLEVNENYERKNIDLSDMVTLSATLSDAKMTHSLYADRYSDANYDCKYRIRVGFNWTSPFYTVIFDDQVAVAWAGNFNISESTILSQADYYKCYGLGIWYYGACSSRCSFS